MPDSIQVRDKDYTLIAYFRADKPNCLVGEIFHQKKPAEIQELISLMPYGRLINVDALNV